MMVFLINSPTLLLEHFGVGLCGYGMTHEDEVCSFSDC